MSYQVIARKWRPQRFDDVVGQRGVTQTLRNAIALDRVAQAFVFAGPRGVGKTTTARILARALNCVSGPTADPCGECDACVEIAAGRDIDVLEIDAATHTQVENVREVIIAGLSITPVRDRYKVFIIDEVHQLSSSSFNALLKSIEEPPPHVVFIMATTLLGKIPDTILSRSQVFEFRTIGTAEINRQLRAIIESEGVTIDDAGLALIARSAAGSMRDAQSALDQVIAFAGESASADEVSTVLGLVGRDAVFEVAETVADETAPRVFELAGRFVEAGYDLRLVCRELSRLVRDMLVLKVDPARIGDPDIAADAERERLQALAARFSREDLLRGFDVLTRAESEIRSAAQPRYHFEVAMLRWMHLRTLVPLTELVAGLERQPAPAVRPHQTLPPAVPPRPKPGAATPAGAAPERPTPTAAPSPVPPPAAAPPSAPSPPSAAAAPARPDDPQGSVSRRVAAHEEVLLRYRCQSGATDRGGREHHHLHVQRRAADAGQAGGDGPSVARGAGEEDHGSPDEGGRPDGAGAGANTRTAGNDRRVRGAGQGPVFAGAGGPRGADHARGPPGRDQGCRRNLSR